MNEHGIVVDFCGDTRTVETSETLTFGRDADIVIDENRFLHRVLGEFVFRSGFWWLRNVGSTIALNVHDATSPSSLRIAPGSSLPIAFVAASIRFEAGGHAYELDVHDDAVADGEDDDDHEAGEVDDSLGEMTTTTSALPLTDEQRSLLEALAAPLLAGQDHLPTNRQVAAGLGWTITKYNRKLDALCSKYAQAGVHGLQGTADQLAKDRRQRLAEHVVDAGIVR